MTKKTKIILGSVGVALLVVWGVVAQSNKAPVYETTQVEKTDIVQNVMVTGKVQPAEAVDLSFETTGKIDTVSAQVGDEVALGDTLVVLKNNDQRARLSRAGAGVANASADVRQYEASLLNEQVRLAEIKSGTRSEEVQIAQTSVETARRSVEDASRNLQNVKEKAQADLDHRYEDIALTLEDAYTDGIVALNEQIDSLFRDEFDFDRLVFLTKNSALKTNVERQKLIVESDMQVFQSEVLSLSNDPNAREQALVKGRMHLMMLRDFLNLVLEAVEDNVGLSDSNENLFRGYVNMARVSVNAALSALSTHQQSLGTQRLTNTNAIQAAETNLNAAQQTLAAAEDQLRLKQAGPRPEEIAAQEARIKQAEASVGAARARVSQASADYQAALSELEKTVLKAPIDGIVTGLEKKAGEIVSANMPVVSVISKSAFEIETNIPEVDIAKLAVGKTATATLDAYGSDVVFSVRVSEVDPAETIVDGVATYKVTLEFLEEDERIKSGMTANVVILAQEREAILVVPLRAVSQRDGKKYVRILKEKNQVEEREVEVGLRGSNGNVEILQGLKEQETIILSEKE